MIKMKPLDWILNLRFFFSIGFLEFLTGKRRAPSHDDTDTLLPGSYRQHHWLVRPQATFMIVTDLDQDCHLIISSSHPCCTVQYIQYLPWINSPSPPLSTISACHVGYRRLSDSLFLSQLSLSLFAN